MNREILALSAQIPGILPDIERGCARAGEVAKARCGLPYILGEGLRKETLVSRAGRHRASLKFKGSVK